MNQTITNMIAQARGPKLANGKMRAVPDQRAYNMQYRREHKEEKKRWNEEYYAARQEQRLEQIAEDNPDAYDNMLTSAEVDVRVVEILQLPCIRRPGCDALLTILQALEYGNFSWYIGVTGRELPQEVGLERGRRARRAVSRSHRR